MPYSWFCSGYWRQLSMIMAAAILIEDVKLQDWLKEVFHIKLYKTSWDERKKEYIYSPNAFPNYNIWKEVDKLLNAVNVARQGWQPPLLDGIK
jgi:hypothetical protein